MVAFCLDIQSPPIYKPRGSKTVEEDRKTVPPSPRDREQEEEEEEGRQEATSIIYFCSYADVEERRYFTSLEYMYIHFVLISHRVLFTDDVRAPTKCHCLV